MKPWIWAICLCFLFDPILLYAQNCSQVAPGACDALDTCYYNVAFRNCSTVPLLCSQRLGYHQCAKGADCIWSGAACVNRTRSSVDAACFVEHHGLDASIACQQDPRCEYDISTERCIQDRDTACSNASTLTCATTSGCAWSTTRAECAALTRTGYGECWGRDFDPVGCNSLPDTWQCAYNESTAQCNPAPKQTALIWVYYCGSTPDDDVHACNSKPGCHYLNDSLSWYIPYACVPNTTAIVCGVQYLPATCNNYYFRCEYNLTSGVCLTLAPDWSEIGIAVTTISLADVVGWRNVQSERHANIISVAAFVAVLLTIISLVACSYRLSDRNMARMPPATPPPPLWIKAR